jgi:hypothetical protein
MAVFNCANIFLNLKQNDHLNTASLLNSTRQGERSKIVPVMVSGAQCNEAWSNLAKRSYER